MFNKIRSALSSKYAEQYEFKKFDEMFANLLKTAQPNINGEKKNAYAGDTSRTADLSLLQQAKQLDEQGANSEEIRQKTGWFKGYDGMWRYEIDDSAAEIKDIAKFSVNFDLSNIGKEYNLPDILKHDTLYKSYPNIKNVKVVFKELSGNELGNYNRKNNTITLDVDYITDTQLKKTLIHEIQHAIQTIENFASGSSPRKSGSYDNYINTAGEIEARDVANRIDMTAEQRKNTRPDIDRTDVVFADGNVSHFSKESEYDPETASVKEQLENSKEKLTQLDIACSILTPKSFTSKQQAANYAIQRLKKWGYKVERQNFGTVLFSENDIRYATNYLDTNEEKATIIAVPYVIKRGIEIGKHNNHKSRQKQTITFAAPVELNGQTGHMAVVVNLNGNHYYVSRIINPDGSAFVFNKNEVEQESYRGVRNNASLADTTSSTSTTNIPNNSPNVNPKSENNQNISPDTTQQSQSGDTPADITLAAGVFHADKHFTNPARDLFHV